MYNNEWYISLNILLFISYKQNAFNYVTKIIWLLGKKRLQTKSRIGTLLLLKWYNSDNFGNTTSILAISS